jgi:hypothetical protein
MAGDTKIAAIKLRGRALNNVPRVNSQVAGWRTGNRLEPEKPAIDARIVSAHNDGNPLFGVEAIAQEL